MTGWKRKGEWQRWSHWDRYEQAEGRERVRYDRDRYNKAEEGRDRCEQADGERETWSDWDI